MNYERSFLWNPSAETHTKQKQQQQQVADAEADGPELLQLGDADIHIDLYTQFSGLFRSFVSIPPSIAVAYKKRERRLHSASATYLVAPAARPFFDTYLVAFCRF